MQLTDEELDVLFDLECQKPCTEEETKKFLEDFERLLPEMCGTIPKFFQKEYDDGECRKKGSRI